MRRKRLRKKPVKKSETQVVGRLGELLVEQVLITRGWLVANFNASIRNAAIYDLCAVREQTVITVRVKARRADVSAFRWSVKKNGVIFSNIRKSGDFVIAVSTGDAPEFYVLPTHVVNRALKRNYRHYRKDRPRTKDWSARIIWLSGSPKARSRGYAQRWRKYWNNWSLLKQRG